MIMGFTVLVGWKLGILESIIYVMVVGMSVDYVVHLGEAYLEAVRLHLTILKPNLYILFFICIIMTNVFSKYYLFFKLVFRKEKKTCMCILHEAYKKYGSYFYHRNFCFRLSCQFLV